MADDSFALTMLAPPLTQADYETIHAAVMETSRGRWFLQQYAQRNRHAETLTLLTAIERIETAISRQSEERPAAIDAARIADWQSAIARVRQSLTDAQTGQPDPSGDFERLAEAAEAASRRVRVAAEHVRYAAAGLRARGADALPCDDLDRRSAECLDACAQIERTASGMRSVAMLLQELETAMAGATPSGRSPQVQPENVSAHAPAEKTVAPAPSRPEEKSEQLVRLETATAGATLPIMAAIAAAMAAHLGDDTPAPPLPERQPDDPMAPIMALSDEEKIALFT